jgi:hypothetical protein
MKRAVWSLVLWSSLGGAAAPSPEPTPLCHDSAAYRVVEQPAADGTGADVLVRERRSGDVAAPCAFDPRPGEFVIRRRDAERVRALVQSLLLLDNGTGPDGRRLVVWDLKQRRIVFESPYSKLVSADARGIVLWRATTLPPTAENCPQLAQWRAQLLGAAIEAQVRWSPGDDAVRELREQRCAPRQ